jgi:hypothetical protein
MNAVKHGLTGSRLLLQPYEMNAYNQLSYALICDLKPMTELERQAVQKIVDTHFRLNRLAGVENNVFNFGLLANTADTPHDDRIEVMIAQTRAWIERSGSFDTLGRYEARLTRQVLQFTRELEHLQAARERREFRESLRQPEQMKPDTFNPASFCRTPSVSEGNLVITADSFTVLTRLPPNQPLALLPKPSVQMQA